MKSQDTAPATAANERKPYSKPRFYRHGTLEAITENVMLPVSSDANMAGCAQGA